MIPTPYDSQLLAIREMLDDPTEGSAQAGYDLLFKLWLEYRELAEFNQELLQDAIKHSLLVSELRKRLRELRLKSSITGTYLRDKFEAFATEVENYRAKLSEEVKSLDSEKSNTNQRISKNEGEITPSLFGEPNTRTYQKSKVEWLQIALVAIILIMILVLVISPYTYQKIIIVIIAFIGATNLSYVLPKNYGATSNDLPELKLNFKYPRFLSTYDKNTVDVIVKNLMYKEYHGKLTLIFDDIDSLVEPAPDTKLSATLEIPSLGKEAIQFKFILTKKPTQKNLNFHFKISHSNDSQYISNNENFLIAPIPYLRSTSTWLIGTLGTLIVALLWDQLKKFLGF